MQGSTGARTGGLQTSALAIGHASAPIAFMAKEAERRGDLLKPLAGLRNEQEALQADLLALAEGAKSAPMNRCGLGPTAWRCGRHSPRWPPPRGPAMSSGIRPDAGAAKRCSFWSGVVRNR